MLVTFDKLKESAKLDGYNVNSKPFSSFDWPIIQAWLTFKKHIVVSYNDLARDIYNDSPSCADTQVRAERFGSAVDGGVEWVRLYVHAGINFGSTDTLSISGGQLLIDGVLVSSANITYSDQDSVIFVKAVAGTPYVVNSNFFTYTSDGQKPQDIYPAIVDRAVCDYSVVDNI